MRLLVRGLALRERLGRYGPVKGYDRKRSRAAKPPSSWHVYDPRTQEDRPRSLVLRLCCDDVGITSPSRSSAVNTGGSVGTGPRRVPRSNSESGPFTRPESGLEARPL